MERKKAAEERVRIEEAKAKVCANFGSSFGVLRFRTRWEHGKLPDYEGAQAAARQSITNQW